MEAFYTICGAKQYLLLFFCTIFTAHTIKYMYIHASAICYLKGRINQHNTATFLYCFALYKPKDLQKRETTRVERT